MSKTIHFREGDLILTLWVEKELDMLDGSVYLVGWCPEKNNNWVVHPANLVDEVSA